MKSLHETLKAMECCFEYGHCLGCPYNDIENNSDGACVRKMGTDAYLHLIRLKAKAERLEDLEK